MSLTLDPLVWEQRGSSWYKIGKARNAYKIKTCGQCGHEAPMVKRQFLCSVECRSAARKGTRKDTLTSYYGAHSRVKNERGPARGHACVDCGHRAREWSYDGQDPDEQHDPVSGLVFSANPDRYEPRCTRCHARRDHGGERNVRAFHSDAKIAEILAEYRAGGITQTELARKYGVSQAAVSSWVVGRNRHNLLTMTPRA